MTIFTLRIALTLALASGLSHGVANADPIAEFYKGKTVTIVASSGAGGPIDLACRVVARFLPRHIPGNPTIVVRNMPGGGHVLMSNFMFAQAPKDGTYYRRRGQLDPDPSGDRRPRRALRRRQVPSGSAPPASPT